MPPQGASWTVSRDRQPSAFARATGPPRRSGVGPESLEGGEKPFAGSPVLVGEAFRKLHPCDEDDGDDGVARGLRRTGSPRSGTWSGGRHQERDGTELRSERDTET